MSVLLEVGEVVVEEGGGEAGGEMGPVDQRQALEDHPHPLCLLPEPSRLFFPPILLILRMNQEVVPQHLLQHPKHHFINTILLNRVLPTLQSLD